MSYIEREALLKELQEELDFDAPMYNDVENKWLDKGIRIAIKDVKRFPTADVVEVRHDFNVGDFCLYGFTDGNKSLAIVEIVKILDDERGIAELKFHKVIKDNTGNGYFHYLFKSGHTMNGSFEYLRNITPCVDSERRSENEG